MKNAAIITLLLLATTAGATTAREDTLGTTAPATEERLTLGQRLLKPIKWIGSNWSAYDPAYSIPSFYDWAVQLQNTSTFEWLHMESPEGMDINMRSKVSHRLGPYFGYRFLFYGLTVDLSSLGTSQKRKDEFTLSINSNLLNADIIRRRTGGDFRINRLMFNSDQYGSIDMQDVADNYDLGDYIKNSITGVNINVFTNHRKYSNPAAFSNGAIQLRSVGSPIVGLGYTHQKVESDVSDIFASYAAELMVDEQGNLVVPREVLEDLDALWEQSETAYYNKVAELLDNGWQYLKGNNRVQQVARTFLTNHIPTVTTIDDWHLQLGYAYNLVFSRRLLLGMSAIASPGLKRVRASNVGSVSYSMADHFSRLIKKHENRDVPADYFRYSYDDTHVDVNLFARASLTYNHNRWRAGLNASFSNYFYKDNGMRVSNGYGNVTAYVGYCFGRKKQYRYNGELRQEYIMAALTPRQIEEMHDTMPKANIDLGPSYKEEMGRTPGYHSDRYRLNIEGCDLVAGPDGRYGWLEVEDGFVTPGQDTDGRLRKGLVAELDKNGTFTLSAGHKGNFRTGNWWKSQFNIEQIPNSWFPEMLHYSVSGKLTLYLRGRIFGTRKPVKLELNDVCINHGKETKNFSQIAIKSFRSNAPYSIEGRATVNGRNYRVYIEQKGKGRRTDMYISRIAPSNADWMGRIDGQRPVSTLSLPGSHDSGTASLNESPVLTAAQTQHFSVPDQLRDGIRAFDIRLKRNLKYGHFVGSHDGFDSTMVAWDRFLDEHPTECIIALIGSDEGGKWDEEMVSNYRRLIERYPHRFVDQFDARTRLGDVRGKILVLRRQEACPYGKLLKFTDNAVFDYDCFHVEDVYKEHKTWKKLSLVEQNIREAFENDDPDKWYVTFNSIAWSPRRHAPYSYAWGGRSIRKPMNMSLREFVELKDYSNFGIVFLDFYNNHGENPQVVESIISSNFHLDDE